MKRLVLVIFGCAMASVLCACAPAIAPDSANDPEVSSSARQAEGLVPLAEVAEECENLTAADYENLSFADGASIRVPEHLMECMLIGTADFDLEYGEKLLHYWVPDEAWEEQYLTPWEELSGSYPIGPVYEDTAQDGRHWYADIWCYGTVVYAVDDVWPVDDAVVKEYNAFCERPEETVTLSDGDITIAEAVQMGQDFADDWLAQTDLNMDLKVKYVQVCTAEDGSNFINLYYQSFYDSVALCDVLPVYGVEKEYGIVDFETEYIAQFPAKATIVSTQGLSFFGSGSGSVELYERTAECPDILPFSAAAELLSKKMSGYSEYTVYHAAIEYRLILEGSEQPEDTYRFRADADSEPIADAEACRYPASYALYSARPYWAFYLNKTKGQEFVCYVDCLTGEVSVVDNRGR